MKLKVLAEYTLRYGSRLLNVFPVDDTSFLVTLGYNQSLESLELVSCGVPDPAILLNGVEKICVRSLVQGYGGQEVSVSWSSGGRNSEMFFQAVPLTGGSIQNSDKVDPKDGEPVCHLPSGARVFVQMGNSPHETQMLISRKSKIDTLCVFRWGGSGNVRCLVDGDNHLLLHYVGAGDSFILYVGKEWLQKRGRHIALNSSLVLNGSFSDLALREGVVTGSISALGVSPKGFIWDPRVSLHAKWPSENTSIAGVVVNDDKSWVAIVNHRNQAERIEDSKTNKAFIVSLEIERGNSMLSVARDRVSLSRFHAMTLGGRILASATLNGASYVWLLEVVGN